MTSKQHRITPPPELFAEWIASALRRVDATIPEDDGGKTGLIAAEVAIQAAAWGYQQCAMEQLREASRELQAFGIAPSSSDREDGPMFKGSWDGAGNAP